MIGKFIYGKLLNTLQADFGCKVFPAVATKDSQLPYAIYNQVNANPVFAKGTQPMINNTFRIDVYATTYSECQSIAKKIIELLNFQDGFDALSDLCVFSCTFDGQSDGYEDDDMTFRTTLDFRIIINN